MIKTNFKFFLLNKRKIFANIIFNQIIMEYSRRSMHINDCSVYCSWRESVSRRRRILPQRRSTPTTPAEPAATNFDLHGVQRRPRRARWARPVATNIAGRPFIAMNARRAGRDELSLNASLASLAGRAGRARSRRILPSRRS